jgi:hypothetical protein
LNMVPADACSLFRVLFSRWQLRRLGAWLTVQGPSCAGTTHPAVAAERHALTSVWCFFAAILSALIFVIVFVIVAREQRAALLKVQPAHAGAKR